MSNLIILIPFETNTDSDLQQGAKQLQDFFHKPETSSRIGAKVNGIIDRILIQYLTDDYKCQDDDYVIVFAHGSDIDDNLYDNMGSETSKVTVMKKLKAMNASNTNMLLFMVCYSALPDHIASSWKLANEAQTVYGGSRVISNLYSSTRTQVRSICAALELLD